MRGNRKLAIVSRVFHACREHVVGFEWNLGGLAPATDNRQPEVACQLKTEKCIFLLCPAANVMDDKWCAVTCLSIADNHDVGKAIDAACDKIAGQIVSAIGSDRHGPSLPSEKAFLIEDSPVVYVAVRPSKKPFALARVFAEVCTHVEMHQLLKINFPSVAKGSDDNIGTHALAPWYVAVGIVDLSIVGDVVRCHAYLRAGGYYDVDIVGTGFVRSVLGNAPPKVIRDFKYDFLMAVIALEKTQRKPVCS